MKILFTSDWQLGSGSDLGQGDYGPGSRFQDQCDALARIAALAEDEGVQLVAMLGDAFERARPAPHEILAVQDFVRTCIAKGIPVLFLRGNHDARGTVLPSALEIFTFNNQCTVSMLPSIYPLDGVVIATLPWTPTAAIVAAMPDVDRDDVNVVAAEALVAGARGLLERALAEWPDLKPVLVGHWAISGMRLPTGLDTAMLREPVIPVMSLAQSGYALAMFGHIHAAGMIAEGPTPVGYCGSPYVCDWAEAEAPHGVWIYDSEANTLGFREVYDNRRFVTFDVDLSFDRSGGMIYSVPAGSVTDAVVRVRYTVSSDDARHVDHNFIRSDLMSLGAERVLFRPTIVREQRARVSTMAEDLNPKDALDLWLNAQGINGTQAKALHAAHADYLAEVRS